MIKRPLIALILATCAFAQQAPKPPKPGLYAIFKTELGDIRVILYEKYAPVTVATFVGLAQGRQRWLDPDRKWVRRPLYNNSTFYRIVPSMAIQGGSPTGKAAYDCGFAIRDEILPGYRFQLGSLAMANTGQPNSGNCQFFFTAGPAQSWNMKYAIFGQAVEGLDVVEKLIKLPVDGEQPLHPPKLISVTIERVGPPPGKKGKMGNSAESSAK
jgi:cyclophilin family peptidyl-prolyl cis-trans isomerase